MLLLVEIAIQVYNAKLRYNKNIILEGIFNIPIYITVWCSKHMEIFVNWKIVEKLKLLDCTFNLASVGFVVAFYHFAKMIHGYYG
jgi:hypothetical protein